MKYWIVFSAFAVATLQFNVQAEAETIRGIVSDQAGRPVEGVMVSAIDDEHRKWTSVFSQHDGSFAISGLRNVDYNVRTRLMGLADEWVSGIAAGTIDMVIQTRAAVGEELEVQRPASSAFSMLAFDNPRDKLNFKMNCSYCHQVGTLGFRTPEKPVDWETMLRRMDGFGGLYPHTQNTIIGRLMNTYKDDAVDKWPKFVPHRHRGDLQLPPRSRCGKWTNRWKVPSMTWKSGETGLFTRSTSVAVE